MGGLRQLSIAWQYAVHSGMFTDWRRAAQPHLEILREVFKPDCLWASFGNTDVWNIAQDLSRLAAVPWVGEPRISLCLTGPARSTASWLAMIAKSERG